MFGAGDKGRSCPVPLRAAAKCQQTSRLPLRLAGVTVPTGCAAGWAPQAPSPRNDIRDCSADPPVSPTLFPPTFPETPYMGSPPVPAHVPVPPVPATDSHQHLGTSGRAAGPHAHPGYPRLHRALHGCPHGKGGVPRTPGYTLPHIHLSRLYSGSRTSTSPSGTRGCAGSPASAALQVRASPNPRALLGGLHLPAGPHSWGSMPIAWSHSLRASGGPCRLQGERKR